MNWTRLHRLVGIATVVVFSLTGLYMYVRYNHLQGMDDATRLLFRSTHIYILFIGLINVALGLADRAERGWIAGLGSLMLLIAPLLALAGFLEEPLRRGLTRPFTGPAIDLSFTGVFALWLDGVLAERRRRRGAATPGDHAA